MAGLRTSEILCCLVFVLLSVIVTLAIKLNYFSYDDVFVDTVYGRVKGFTSKSRSGITYNSFTSIPYAKPPIGNLRFQPPQRQEKWEGTKDVSGSPNWCMQYDALLLKRILGYEDCLYLSVYTPQIPNTLDKQNAKLLPVMVFIHGGFFMFGSMEPQIYGASYFMDEEIVLVTLNYRVGALGFFNTGDEVVTGNMGLKDQNAALKWVQESIEKFGGDPSKVTLFGESAGAASVHHHMMSEMSKGLFHRAILQSGSSLCPWTYTRNPKKQATHLGNLLNCSTENSKKLVSCLRELKAEAIVETHKSQDELLFDPIEFYLPSIETKTEENKNTIFSSESPYKKAAEGKYINKVPMIIGLNSEEGCLRSAAIINDETALSKLSAQWDSSSKNAFLLFDKAVPEVEEKLWEDLAGSSERKNLTNLNYKKLTDLYSDRYFTKCTQEAAILYSRTNISTYFYYFTYKNQMSLAGSIAASKGIFPAFLEILMGGIQEQVYKWFGWETMDYGVCHADELQNLFKFTIFMNIGRNSPDYEFSKKMIKLWTNFAKDGVPGEVNFVKWTPISQQNENTPLKYLNLDKEFKMIEDPLQSRMKFWKSLRLPRNLEPELEDKFEAL